MQVASFPPAVRELLLKQRDCACDEQQRPPGVSPEEMAAVGGESSRHIRKPTMKDK